VANWRIVYFWCSTLALIIALGRLVVLWSFKPRTYQTGSFAELTPKFQTCNSCKQSYTVANANCIIYVSFMPMATEETILEALLEITWNWLGPNDANHPSFPVTVEKQRNKHLNILKSISYPTAIKMSSIESTVHCDPLKALDTLPFQVFLEIKKIVLVHLSKRLC
jgi:hypothetical protein